MAKKANSESTEIVTVTQTGGALAMPDFMKKDRSIGKEAMVAEVRPPYLKLIKSQSIGDLKQKYGAGAVIIMPAEMPVLLPGDDGFNFVPVFYFTEYLALNSFFMRDKLPMIRKRTFDPNSRLAELCRNPDTWKVPQKEDPQHKMTNRVTLNFIVAILDDDYQPVASASMSFGGGEHKTGRRLIDLVAGRNGPPFGQIWRASVGVHKYKQGAYESEGLDFENADKPFVEDVEVYNALKAQHITFKDAYEKNLLRPEYDEDNLSAGRQDEEIVDSGKY